MCARQATFGVDHPSTLETSAKGQQATCNLVKTSVVHTTFLTQDIGESLAPIQLHHTLRGISGAPYILILCCERTYNLSARERSPYMLGVSMRSTRRLHRLKRTEVTSTAVVHPVIPSHARVRALRRPRLSIECQTLLDISTVQLVPAWKIQGSVKLTKNIRMEHQVGSMPEMFRLQGTTARSRHTL